MPADGEFAGRVALVTGAAGGIRGAVVDRLLAAGASVVGEDIDAIPGRPGERFVAVQGDAGQSSVARAAVRAAPDRFGRLDILVNVAGRFLGRPLAQTSDDDWDALMTANVKSVFVHCREALPALLAGEPGNIVSIGSIAGIVGLRGQAAYSATKAAVAQLTRQIAVDFAPQGLRANVVAPGAVDTTFVSRTRAAPAEQLSPEALAERKAAVGASHPLGRMGRAEEIADVVLYLASPRASFVTGAVISADGGYVAQ
jgi:NAD(P)-dependent dehydrogenase (short-subunit alcohol dehydrogenase family)